MSINTLSHVLFAAGTLLVSIGGMIEIVRNPRILDRHVEGMKNALKKPFGYYEGGVNIFAPVVRWWAIPGLCLAAAGMVLPWFFG